MRAPATTAGPAVTGQARSDAIARVEAALADLRDGRFVVVTDGEGSAMEGDLLMAAERVTPEAVVFMAGLAVIHICLPEDRCRELELLPIAPRFDASRWKTAIAVTIEARTGVTTGISAADRARTIAVAADPRSTASDLVKPGHIVPVIARQGGVLARAGRTEAAIDLPRLAGLTAAGADCDILTADGEQARGDALVAFCREHDIRRVGVHDVVAYRLAVEPLVERVAAARLPAAVPAGPGAEVVTYREAVSGRLHVATVGAAPADGPPAVHRWCLAGQLLGLKGCDCAARFSAAMDAVAAGSAGVLVCLDVDPTAVDAGPVTCVHSQPGTGPGLLRRDAVVRQVLAELGVAAARD